MPLTHIDENFKTILFRHDQVKNENVKFLNSDLLDSLGTIRSEDNVMPNFREQRPEKFSEIQIVVNDEHLCHGFTLIRNNTSLVPSIDSPSAVHQDSTKNFFKLKKSDTNLYIEINNIPGVSNF